MLSQPCCGVATSRHDGGRSPLSTKHIRPAAGPANSPAARNDKRRIIMAQIKMRENVPKFGWKDKIGYALGDFGCNLSFLASTPRTTVC